jgi:hypothetical protein
MRERSRWEFYATHKPVLPLYVFARRPDIDAIAHYRRRHFLLRLAAAAVRRDRPCFDRPLAPSLQPDL